MLCWWSWPNRPTNFGWTTNKDENWVKMTFNRRGSLFYISGNFCPLSWDFFLRKVLSSLLCGHWCLLSCHHKPLLVIIIARQESKLVGAGNLGLIWLFRWINRNINWNKLIVFLIYFGSLNIVKIVYIYFYIAIHS